MGCPRLQFACGVIPGRDTGVVGTKQIGVRLAVAGRGRGRVDFHLDPQAWVKFRGADPGSRVVAAWKKFRVPVGAQAINFDGEVLIYNSLNANEHKLKVIHGLFPLC